MSYKYKVHIKLAELELKVHEHLKQAEDNTNSLNSLDVIKGVRQTGITRGILTAIKEIREIKGE